MRKAFEFFIVTILFTSMLASIIVFAPIITAPDDFHNQIFSEPIPATIPSNDLPISKSEFVFEDGFTAVSRTYYDFPGTDKYFAKSMASGKLFITPDDGWQITYIFEQSNQLSFTCNTKITIAMINISSREPIQDTFCKSAIHVQKPDMLDIWFLDYSLTWE